MANRSTGAFVKANWQDYGILFRHEDGGSEMIVKNADSYRLAYAMVYRDAKRGGVTGKIISCKSKQDMDRDERAYWGFEEISTYRPIDYSVLDMY